MSLYGQVADMTAINAIAARHGLPVVEDAAQSFGATLPGPAQRRHQTIGCTSFFPSKPLGCYGDGGALFTDDDALAQAAREIRVHGQSARYTHTRVGVGGRMDTLQCAVVLAKLPRFAWELERRRELGARYHALLAPLVARHAGFGLLAVRPDRRLRLGPVHRVRAGAGQGAGRAAGRRHPDRGALPEAAAPPDGLCRRRAARTAARSAWTPPPA